ncbi:zinc finger protein 865 [Drosophila grimshawi]|uniref:GH22075 n=1 Tax=Drosophila grimshawi TaxID=7222 RepID=B4J9Z0_DROGR|nr:zinc finger protein 865 [Drosophila grimshawi]EDW02577.1 GH22075 [Drosophila grimshawi]
MEHEFVPKSPTSTLCEDESDDGNNAKFLGPIHPPTPFTGGHPFNGNANVSISPLLLATPPLSPLDMSVQNPNMPMASAMLSSNYSSLYPPTGYIRIIPCFVCSQLFTDIVPLSKHLQMHATQILHMNSTNAPTPATIEKNSLNLGLPTAMSTPVLPAPVNPIPATSDESPPNASPFKCDYCRKVFKNSMSHRVHQRLHRLPSLSEDRLGYKRQFKCHICRKSYVRETFLQKHIEAKHSRFLGPVRQLPTQVESQGHLAAIPGPASPPPANADIEPKKIYTTRLANAVAAAAYNPARETASKYIPPTVVGHQQVDSYSQLPPQQKYVPRSPYFNPNLWFYEDYV